MTERKAAEAALAKSEARYRALTRALTSLVWRADAEGRFLALMLGEEEPKRDKKLGDLRALEGVSKLPVRIKCALLGWNALDEAVKAYRKSGRGLMGETLAFEDLTALPEGFDPGEHKEDLPD